MKKFIEQIKDKDKKLNQYYAKAELKNINTILDDLEREHTQVKKNLKDINYLLDLIEKHQITTPEDSLFGEDNQPENWFSEIKNKFEKLHLTDTKDLTTSELDYLNAQKAKLIVDKKKFDEIHKHLHLLIAKTNAYLKETQDAICTELTQNESIKDLAKILAKNLEDDFKGDSSYEKGRKIIIHFLEKQYSINKIKATVLFNILEQESLVGYKTDLTNTMPYPTYEDFADFGNMTYINYTIPTGKWFIKG